MDSEQLQTDCCHRHDTEGVNILLREEEEGGAC